MKLFFVNLHNRIHTYIQYVVCTHSPRTYVHPSLLTPLPPHIPSYCLSSHIPTMSFPCPSRAPPSFLRCPSPFCPMPLPLSSRAPPPFSAGIQRRPSSHPVRVQRRSHPLEGLPPPPRLPQPPQASHLGPLQGIRTVSWAAQGGEGGRNLAPHLGSGGVLYITGLLYRDCTHYHTHITTTLHCHHGLLVANHYIFYACTVYPHTKYIYSSEQCGPHVQFVYLTVHAVCRVLYTPFTV